MNRKKLTLRVNDGKPMQFPASWQRCVDDVIGAINTCDAVNEPLSAATMEALRQASGDVEADASNQRGFYVAGALMAIVINTWRSMGRSDADLLTGFRSAVAQTPQLKPKPKPRPKLKLVPALKG